MSKLTDYYVVDVQGQLGQVNLNTDQITEGSTNLYFTDARVEANPTVTGTKAVTDLITVTGTRDLDDIRTKITELSDGSYVDYHDHLELLEVTTAVSAGESIRLTSSGTVRPVDTYVSEFAGIAQEDGSIGDTINVAVNRQISRGHSDLTPGSVYYVQVSGTLDTTTTDYQAGQAVTASTLKLDIQDFSHENDTTLHFTEAEISIDSSKISDFNEAVQDSMGTLISGGDQTGITITYDDQNARFDITLPEATTSGLGLAQFDSSNFTVVSGEATVNNTGSVAEWLTGVSGSRPVGASNGTRYFDTTIGKPIWKHGASWVDAAGTTV